MTTTLYMLDTDICAFVLRRSSELLLLRIQAVPIAQQCMSVVSYAELLYGVALSSQKKTNQAAVEALARHVSVLDWTQEAAQHYAQIRTDLKKTGSMVGANDLMIAAHARSLGACLVTNNTKDFERIRDLNIENWMA
jgi:tRNA(fMet)-specific endonuclease VapC